MNISTLLSLPQFSSRPHTSFPAESHCICLIPSELHLGQMPCPCGGRIALGEIAWRPRLRLQAPAHEVTRSLKKTKKRDNGMDVSSNTMVPSQPT